MSASKIIVQTERSLVLKTVRQISKFTKKNVQKSKNNAYPADLHSKTVTRVKFHLFNKKYYPIIRQIVLYFGQLLALTYDMHQILDLHDIFSSDTGKRFVIIYKMIKFLFYIFKVFKSRSKY